MEGHLVSTEIYVGSSPTGRTMFKVKRNEMIKMFITMFMLGCIVVATSAQAAPQAKPETREECIVKCNTVWTKQYHECNNVTQCEIYTQHQSEACVRSCDGLK